MVVSRSTGSGRAHGTAKREIADSMYAKGLGFLGESVLLRKYGGDAFVVLHLHCQGLELVLKAALLFKDFDKYRSRLTKDFGHDLAKTAKVAAKVFGQKPMNKALQAELGELSRFYRWHLLRYGTIADIFIDRGSVASELVAARTPVLLRLIRRKRALLQASTQGP
jgi:hypothetical protein